MILDSLCMQTALELPHCSRVAESTGKAGILKARVFMLSTLTVLLGGVAFLGAILTCEQRDT